MSSRFNLDLLLTCFKQKLFKYRFLCLSLTTLVLVANTKLALAQSPTLITDESAEIKTFWLIISGILVFSMNAGFAMLEAGFCTRKNLTNILAKNLIVFCIATLAFWAFGFSLMYSDHANPLLGGLQGAFFYIPFASEAKNFPDYYSQLETLWGDRSFAAVFFFQLVFAGTAATIISGAVAERIKFRAFALFSFVMVAFIYPFIGHWVWATDGLLKNPNFLNFQDFAGSAVVHSVGGAAALSGALLLGTRLDYSQRYQPEFRPNNLGFGTLGCFILWLGWFGFNGGSAQDLANVPHIVVTTMMSAASGGIAVLFFAILFEGQRKLATLINGILGGLVGITGASAYVELRWAFLIGIVSGLFVLWGEYILERCQIDDPVGAIPVHLFCGLWGTLAVGLFCDLSGQYSSEYVYKYSWLTQTFYQLLGWIVIVTTTFLLSSLAWLFIGNFLAWRERFSLLNRHSELKPGERNFFTNGCYGIRVSPQLERIGSDDFFEQV